MSQGFTTPLPIPLPISMGGTGQVSSTGTGLPSFQTSPTFITPTLGVATATSLTFSPTTDGIVGTTTNDSASTGYVGEIISSVIASGGAVTQTYNASVDITSISLTAGDWDVYGNANWPTVGNWARVETWTSTSSATKPDPSLYANITAGGSGVSIPALVGISAPFQRYSLSSTANVYLSAFANGTSTNGTVCGGIYARRVR